MSLPLDDAFDAAAALEESGAFGEALKAYDEIFREHEDETDYESREAAARAQAYQAEILDELGHHEDELALRQRIVERERDAPEHEMRVRVARTLVNIGVTFNDLGRDDDELATYDLVVEEYGDAEERDLADQVMRALSRKASALARRGRLDESLVLFDAVIARDEALGDGRRSRTVARALIDAAARLSEAGRLPEAIDTARRTAEYLDEAAEPRLVELALRAKVNEAIFLGRLGRNDEALAIYEDVLELPVDLDDDGSVEDVLRASVYRARTIGNMGRLDEALDCLRETTDRLAGASGSDARKWLASTLGVYAKMLVDGGRPEDAVAVYDAAVVLLDRPHTLEQREMVADALIAKGIVLRDLGDRAGAAAAFRSVFDRFGDDTGGRLPNLAAWSGFTAARLLHRYRQPAEMRELSQLLVARFEDSEDEAVQELVWRAGLNARGLAYRERILRALRLRYPRLRRDRE